eukprot:1230256-Amphidinium_carterae.1
MFNGPGACTVQTELTPTPLTHCVSTIVVTMASRCQAEGPNGLAHVRRSKLASIHSASPSLRVESFAALADFV